MTKDEMQLLRDMMKEEIGAALEPVNKRLDQVQEDLGAVKEDLGAVKEDLEAVKEDTEITRGAVNALVEWADNVAVVTGQRFPVKKAE